MLKGIGWTLSEATRAPAMMSIGGVTSALVISTLIDRGHAAMTLRVMFLCMIVVLGLFAFIPPSVLVWTSLLLVAGILGTGSHYCPRQRLARDSLSQ